MKISLTNSVMLNGGDAAIVYGTLVALRSAFGHEIEVTVHASRPEVVSRIYPDISVLPSPGLYVDTFPQIRFLGRIVREIKKYKLYASAFIYKTFGYIPTFLFSDPSIPDAIKKYARADMVVSVGGTYLRDDYDQAARSADFQITLLLERPLALFTQSIGPFTRALATHPLRKFLQRSFCILLRDERSRKYLSDMGINGPVVDVVADVAFALGDEAVLRAAAKPRALRQPMRVAISVRDWPHFATCEREVGMRRYKQAVADLVRHLVENCRARVMFISTCQGLAEYEDDTPVAESIMQVAGYSGDESVEVVKGFKHFSDVSQIISTCDYAVCTRLHVAILSLLGGTPVLPIAYEFKSSELFAKFGLSEYVLDIESVYGEQLITYNDQFLQNVQAIRQNIFPQILDMRVEAIRSAELLRRSFLERIGQV